MSIEQTLEQNKTFIRNHLEEWVNRKNSAIAYQKLTVKSRNKWIFKL